VLYRLGRSEASIRGVPTENGTVAIPVANKQGKRRSRVRDIPIARELPGEGDLGEETFETRTIIDVTPQDRVRMRIESTARNSVAGWFLGHETKVAGGWELVVEYDWSHGGPAHRHRRRRTRRGSIRVGDRVELPRTDGQEEAWDQAYGDLVDNMDTRRERYLNG
jgi:hypothetical protein